MPTEIIFMDASIWYSLSKLRTEQNLDED
jgi:hypothetical protein